jgi:hypothetical protein
MNLTTEIINNMKKDLEDIINNNDNININNELQLLINKMDDTIININNNVDNKQIIKNNIIFKIFMPYIIYLSSIIKDDDIDQLINIDNTFNKDLFKEIIKKYIN